jgi:hypothetical protein
MEQENYSPAVARAFLRFAIRLEMLTHRHKLECARDFNESELRWLAAFREQAK